MTFSVDTKNPREYNTYSCNKKNLLKSYKMYLAGEDDIPNLNTLKMMIYIMFMIV